MPLPLPFKVTDPPDPESIQANFDEIAKQFPFSRKHIKSETPHVVGDATTGLGTTFQNGWVNYDPAAFYPARFWKDVNGDVHIQGLVKSGTVGTTIFVLPVGYRPGNGLGYPTDSNNAHGRVDIAPTGNVVAQAGSNVYFFINLPPFRQEG